MIALVALGVFGIAPYFVFIVATVVTAMLNYPKNFGEIFAKVGPMYLNILIMLIAINVYQAVFNNTGMVGAISDALMQFCPEFLLRYIHIILLLLCVVIIYVIPFQILTHCTRSSFPSGRLWDPGRGSHRTLCLQPVTGYQLHADNSSTYTGCALTETEYSTSARRQCPSRP